LDFDNVITEVAVRDDRLEHQVSRPWLRASCVPSAQAKPASPS
jgi:hypothetical protein